MEQFIKSNLTKEQAINALACGVAQYVVYGDGDAWRWSLESNGTFTLHHFRGTCDIGCNSGSFPYASKYHLSNELKDRR